MAALVVAAVVLTGSQVVIREAFIDMPGGTPVGLPSAHDVADPGRIVVAVVIGQTGTIASDALAPYDVFASSSSFSVYTVAEHASPAPLTGGTSLVPAHTFADVDAGRTPAPDLVVVPAVSDPTGEPEQAMRSWISTQAQAGAHIMSVCNGAEVLAATGVLDGHRATSHWSGLDGLRQARPEVTWVGGQRWVHDGQVTTTAAVSSGIPGSLAVVRQMAGAAEANRVGEALAYPGWELDGTADIPHQRFTTGDLSLDLGHTLPWSRPDVAIGLTDGVGEIDVAAALEVYHMSAAARTFTVATTPTITTRHGVVLTATTTTATPAGIASVVVPGAARLGDVEPALSRWATDHEITVMPLGTAGGALGFDAALEHIARQTGTTTARSVAKMIAYPTDHLELSGPADLRTPALAALTLTLAVAVGLLPTAVRARRARTNR